MSLTSSCRIESALSKQTQGSQMAADYKLTNSTHQCGNVDVSRHASVHEGDTVGHIGVATPSITYRKVPGKSA
jgi:hypothetical protein